MNSTAIIILCSHLCVGENVKPLEPMEWTNLANLLYAKKLQPKDVITFSADDFINKLEFNKEQADRLTRLIDRSGSLAFEIEKYQNIGIKIITRADSGYPKRLKKVLSKNCPPLFYCAGNSDISDRQFIGFVGSRTIGEKDIAFTQKCVNKMINRGFSAVSGGAKGIDSISSEEALNIGGVAMEYISDSLMRKLKNKTTIDAIKSGRLFILSVSKPDVGFNAGIAMMRNKYIYANSIGTVVVKSEYNKGGTWSGATENLKNCWCQEFCWNNTSYAGNIELIRRGAIPIDENWDADVSSFNLPSNVQNEQLSLFDI